LLPKIPPGGFQAFSVKDDLNALDNAAKPAPQPAAEKADASNSANQPEKIEIDLGAGKPDVIWDRYFAANHPQPKAVRQAVRELMDQRKYDHVIALINAALRHRQVQPWMYEALTLAMQAAGSPKEDIERAIMSAVDFADNVADLIYVGTYLSKVGLNQRALQVFRQAAELEPLRPEPYMLGLRAAREANDLDGLKWTSVGILSQAWPTELAHVWQAGLGVSKEVLDKLRAEKRTQEADAFLAQLDEAVRRDCVVVVTWTGEADVDVMVEEPGGTLCSLRSPRTPSGGMLLGDGISQIGRDSYGGHSEVYVCPKGFDGKYRMLVRRVWGKVAADKVNVEVVTNFGGPNSSRLAKRIPLDKGEAIVEFELKNGRRKEPINQQQLANDVGGQLAINRQILAQQLAGAIDPAAMAGLAQSRSGGNSGGAGGNDALRRLLGSTFGGAVGYQPVITVLPEGTQMTATAVISADRRYVRITAEPQFTGVGEVNTFNMATGESGTSNGGTGGQGYGGLFGGGMGGMGGMGGGGIF
jgi:tetratricopeptide (TPR) repeat protein